MTAIQRNGLSGLVLKVAAITLVALIFGFAPKAPASTPFAAQAELAKADL